MKKKLKIAAVTAVIIFCMLQGCVKKEKQEELLLIPTEEENTAQDVISQDAGAVFSDISTVDSAGEGRSSGDGEDGAGKDRQYCVVHICGAVKEPGVYTLEEKSRIYQAVEEAGGFREDAASDYLNQADLIADGMKIYVPTKEEADSLAFPGGWTNTGSEEKEKGLVNINTAGEELLKTLPGVGESKARSIIAYREKNGGFRQTEDIMNVEGIKEGLFQKIKDSITV